MEVGLPMRLLLRAGTMVFFRHDQMEYRRLGEGLEVLCLSLLGFSLTTQKSVRA